jgi:hypothetical protein
MSLARLGRLGIVASLAAGLAACGAPKDPVQALLDEIVEAAEARDAAAVVAHLAEGFEGKDGMRRGEARATLQRYFAAYRSVDLTLYDLRLEDEQRASFRVDFAGRPRDVGGLAGLLPGSATYSFQLSLLKGPDGLVVEGATWQPWTPPEPAG